MSGDNGLPTVTSIQVGGIREYPGPPRPWSSAIAKTDYLGMAELGPSGLIGDAQADLVHHGGVDKAVLMFAQSNYPRWRPELGRDLPYGSFGENLTVEGIDEHGICIGDRIRIGTSLAECTQPRQPCWKLSRHLDVVRLAQRVEEAGTTGWYLRIIEAGSTSLGDPCAVVDRPHPHATIAWANSVMHGQPVDLAASASLGEIPQLSASWKASMSKRLDGHDVDVDARRFGG